MTTLVLREGGASDASTIADIHTRSWQTAYRGLGVLSDAYLDGVANAEMHAKWRERMTAPVAGQYVWCADLDGETIGFLCAMREDNTPWGALVDNLRVAHGREPYRDLERAMWQIWAWTNESLAVPPAAGPNREWMKHPSLMDASRAGKVEKEEL